ncbi:transcriptional regulator [Sphingomonas melonis]|uniref:transcriptional regulator n=1 Tax=Sphingomonas melonis TaxID=152682 RepID=UPI00037BEA36|nr:YdaS family helix-turn-helix protein [Sphingomonas melonis]
MNTRTTPFEALKASVEAIGSQSAYARLCGVSQTAVWKWLQSGKRLPAEHVITIEAESGVSRHLLRPDIYPVDVLHQGVRTDDSEVAASPFADQFDLPAVMKRSAGQ